MTACLTSISYWILLTLYLTLWTLTISISVIKIPSWALQSHKVSAVASALTSVWFLPVVPQRALLLPPGPQLLLQKWALQPLEAHGPAVALGSACMCLWLPTLPTSRPRGGIEQGEQTALPHRGTGGFISVGTGNVMSYTAPSVPPCLLPTAPISWANDGLGGY